MEIYQRMVIFFNSRTFNLGVQVSKVSLPGGVKKREERSVEFLNLRRRLALNRAFDITARFTRLGVQESSIYELNFSCALRNAVPGK